MKKELMKIMKYALIVVEREHVLKKGKIDILHATLYENPPTFIDYTNLYRELATDKELGLTNRNDIVIVPATENMMKEFKKKCTLKTAAM